jgi:hypothetical protein
MRRVVSTGTIAVVLALAAVAYAADVTCDGGRCEGTDEPDTITGSLKPDAIYTGDGSDDVDARAGQDYARGAEGEDAIEGGRGEDILRGNRDADNLDGGQGDDHIFGHASPEGGPALYRGEVTASGISEILSDTASGDADAVYGGRGSEVFNVQDGDGDDYVNCGPGGFHVVALDQGDVLDC